MPSNATKCIWTNPLFILIYKFQNHRFCDTRTQSETAQQWGILEDCHFEHCSFYGVKFENATILNTFFKHNDRFKKVQFVNCKVDSITYAFLKTNQANLTGIELL